MKCKCRKWPCMSHSDIYSISYGRKKGRESNWQFDSRPLKVDNQPNPGVCRWSVTHIGKLLKRATILLQTSSQSEVWTGSYELPKSRESKPGQFRDSSLGVPGQKAIPMWVPWPNAKKYYMGEGGGFPWVRAVVSQVSPCCLWLVPTPIMLLNVN